MGAFFFLQWRVDSSGVTRASETPPPAVFLCDLIAVNKLSSCFDVFSRYESALEWYNTGHHCDKKTSVLDSNVFLSVRCREMSLVRAVWPQFGKGTLPLIRKNSRNTGSP